MVDADRAVRGDGRAPVTARAGTARVRVRPPAGPCPARQATFLDVLAETCCIGEALAAVNGQARTFYALRRRDPAFAERWREAVAAGYDAVETRLLRYVLSAGRATGAAEAVADGFAGRPVAGVGKVGEGVPAWVQVAVLLLNRHRATATGQDKGNRLRRIATPEETDALLAKRLDQLYRSRGSH